jgi:predicted amidohydrolase
VVAAGQIGDHEPGAHVLRRSMVIDPWGTVHRAGAATRDRATAGPRSGRWTNPRELPSLANRRL